MARLKINAERLWASLMETAQMGATADGGVRRLTLSEEDRSVRNWFRRACEEAGCTVTVDRIGNMFARRPGRNDNRDPIAMGSHLDTQPNGGKFDGILGVLAGLEVMRTLEEAGHRTDSPLMLVNWTNEEGARFAPAMMGSAVHAGVLALDEAYAARDKDGISACQALDLIGYKGSVHPGSVRMSAMFELHIEQGPLLEASARQIGIVQGIQGMRWFEVQIYGQSAHAGTTPLNARRDALVEASTLIVNLEQMARRKEGLATVGQLSVSNSSRNVVPGEVRMTVDLRHRSESELDHMERLLRAALAVVDGQGFKSACQLIWTSPPVSFDKYCISAAEKAAADEKYETMEIISGAGHDSANISKVAPTTMIFIPCKEGLSHNPAESASFEDCATGAQTLLGAVLNYDRLLCAANDSS